MEGDKVRKRGILLVSSRIDRNWVKETWLYKLEKININIYDPSPPEIQRLISQSSKKSKEKFDTLMSDLCTLRKVHKLHRRKGEERKEKRGLKNQKAVNLYIKKKLRIKRKKRRLKKRKKGR